MKGHGSGAGRLLMGKLPVGSFRKRAVLSTMFLALAASGLSQSPAPAPAQPQIGVAQTLGLASGIAEVETLQNNGQGDSLVAVNVRQELFARILDASFDVHSTLARIDTEEAYVSEKRYVLDKKNRRTSTALNLATFAASATLGVAGSALQLTHNLNHTGSTLQLAAGGAELVLTGVQLRSNGGKIGIDSPYNMLAEVLGQQPNTESAYPPVVVEYLKEPRIEGLSTATAVNQAWRRLGHLEHNPQQNVVKLRHLTADRTSGEMLSADELADREAMLHDLHALIANLDIELQQTLRMIERPDNASTLNVIVK